MVWVGRDVKTHPVSVQGHPPPSQGAPSPIQPHLGHFQGWCNVHQCLVPPPPPPQTEDLPWYFFQIPDINLPSVTVKPFLLVLSLSALVKSPSQLRNASVESSGCGARALTSGSGCVHICHSDPSSAPCCQHRKKTPPRQGNLFLL